MANPFFQFKQFTVHHDRCAMKVTTDSCFFGAWAANEIQNTKPERQRIETVLDIGTGSGLLSLMMAQKNEVTFDAVEIEAEASEQARQNIQASPWESRIRIYTEDICSFKPGKKYDCIISNPPFYEKELSSSKPGKNVAHHSKQLTLSTLLVLIEKHLAEDGIFFLLLPAKRMQEINKLLAKNELFVSKSILLQQSVTHAPFRFLVMGSRKRVEVSQTTISVRNEKQEYTSEFINLLKDYYLYLDPGFPSA